MYNGETMMLKSAVRRPVPKKENYLKYGFAITEHINYYCPECGYVLNAGPNYQPAYCDQCGQRVTFDRVDWKEEKTLGYLPAGHRGEHMNRPKTEWRGAGDEVPELAV